MGEGDGSEAAQLDAAEAALANDDVDGFVAALGKVAGMPAGAPGDRARVERLRIAAYDRMRAYMRAVGATAEVERQLALCDLVLALAPAPDADRVEATLSSALYLIDLQDEARRQPYIRRLFDLSRPLAAEPLGPEAPESDAEAGPEAAARILAAHGTVLVRGLVSLARCDTARLEFEAAVAVEAVAAKTLLQLEQGANVVRGKAGQFLKAALAPLLRDPTFFPNVSTVRRVDPRDRSTATPFHQDTRAFGYNLINVWVPLVPCGRTAPGIELVARRIGEPLPTTDSDDQYHRVRIDRDLVVDRFGEAALYAPEMTVGDVLIFLGSTIHRTHLTPEMTLPRSSLELRFISSFR